MPPLRTSAAAAGLLALLAAPAFSQTQRIDFATQVRPLLEKRCFQCHGPDQKQGGLRLDVKSEALRGGDSGAVILPGRAAQSPLIRRVTDADPKKVMPPAGPRLTAAEVSRIRAWIDQGAAWPESSGASSSSHWAFQAPRLPAVPAVRNRAWVRGPIDAFVLARLERERVQPSPAADRATLLRRLSLDLTGLPPTPAELDAFLADPRPEAYEKEVDRLLDSPHYGERWGRHWLDLARYADSDGYEKDQPRPYAYLYRDWVIDALNRDMPFDRFTVEQLAGDLLPNATVEQKIATGFHRNTLKNKEGGVDQEEDRNKIAVDRVNTTGAVWLGLTVGCAECHSHKYDPISQREYYQLFAFFNTVEDVDIPVPGKDQAARAQTLAENPKPPATFVHVRGDFLRKGEEVKAGTLTVLPPLRQPEPSRLDLARWLVDPANPLTARVAVNRVWQHLFGQGLVRTPNDWGTRGERPSHPELLDWLAVKFSSPELGWSQKRLIKLIVMSATYQQASRSRPDLEQRDPRNVLLARQNRFRPEAEIVRDLYLAASGLLNPEVGGPSIRPPLPADIAALGYANSVKWVESKGPERYKRGMYIFFQRTVPYPLLATFDAPDSNVSCTRRERSNTPLQALTLLNDPVFFEAAQALGQRLAAERTGVEDRIRLVFRTCLTREPAASEAARLRRLYVEMRGLCEKQPDVAAKIAGPAAAAEVSPAEAAAWVIVARTVLNPDEFVTRE